MHYSTSEMTRRLGITREMLRYYEKEGLIRPQRQMGNGYRAYSQADGFDILRIKDLQALHFSLEDAQRMLHSRSLDAHADCLRGMEMQLEEKIRSLNAQLLRIRMHRSFIEDALAGDNEVVEMDTYGIYRLMMLGEIEQDEDEAARTQTAVEWIRKMPFTEIGWTIDWPESFEQGRMLRARIGLQAMPHCAFEQNLATEPPVTFFPPGRSLRMMVTVEDPFCVPASLFAPLEAYAQAHRYRVVSGITGRYSGTSDAHGAVRHHFSARVLVHRMKK